MARIEPTINVRGNARSRRVAHSRHIRLRRWRNWLSLALVACICVWFAGSNYGIWDRFITPSATVSGKIVHFSLCQGSHRITCVVDGDTIWFKGQKIRIADIDAPEVFSPKCASELALGNRATGRLTQLLNAGPIEIAPYGTRDRDVYHRELRVIERNGTSLGAVLVAEGLARKWDGARHPWC